LPGGDRVGLGEIAFMNLPASFHPGDLIPRKIDGDDFGTLTVGATQSGQEFGPPSAPAAGLLEEWFNMGPQGSKAAIDSAFAANAPAVPAFRPESGITWWSGSDDVADVPKYPSEVGGVVTGDNYSVRLTGEILIEKSGPIQFLDGVDDYTYLAIDTDRSGVAGDSASEVLIDDNNWTNALSNANGGAPIVEVDFQNIAAGGEWLAIEVNTSEGGGGDSGIIYWDAQDEKNFFPQVQGEGVHPDDAAIFMIPNSHLRSSIRELIGANASGSLAEAIGQADVLELNVQVGPGGNDQIVLEDLSIGTGKTTLDVAGTTVRVVASGELAEGAEFQIFGADVVTGIDSLHLLFDDPSRWNLSALSQGKIIFGAAGCIVPVGGLAGDLDGNGDVAFADFLLLAGNFGAKGVAYSQGDINCDGEVAFSDFLVLAENFGKSAAAAQPVPEPTSLALAGFATLACGLFRRRRHQSRTI
jgi:hypothetical protein